MSAGHARAGPVQVARHPNNQRSQVLLALITQSAERGTPSTGDFEDLHFKVGVRAIGERMVIVWKEQGHRPSASQAEEIGEDAGLFAPVFGHWRCRESARAVLIHESFFGQLCTHHWTMPVHYDGKLIYGHIMTCRTCGVRASTERARRGTRLNCTCDTWGLRPHIFSAWQVRGPAPGQLTVQTWHAAARAHGTKYQHAPLVPDRHQNTG